MVIYYWESCFNIIISLMLCVYCNFIFRNCFLNKYDSVQYIVYCVYMFFFPNIILKLFVACAVHIIIVLATFRNVL